MNYSLFIARRILSGGQTKNRLSGPVVKIATTAIALGMAVMIVAVAVGLGFKKEIRDKLVGFGTHVQIMSMDFNQSYETSPIRDDSLLVEQIRTIEGVRNVQPFVLKPGIIKTQDAIQGIALKGIDASFDTTFLHSIMVEGQMIGLSDSTKSGGIVISRTMADMLRLEMGGAVRMYFIQNGIRARKFTVEGIFDSHFPEFDEKMAYVDMRQLTQLNGWENGQISGYEVLLNDFDQIRAVNDEIKYFTSTYIAPGTSFLRSQSIYELQPQMFGWLSLLDTNIVVILVLIIAVAGLNMVAGLLILILENTNTIGLLKAMGATNSKIRRIFIYMAVRIIGRGMLIGNIIGIALCVIQSQTGVVGLDPENYYLDTVPILLQPHVWLGLNLLILTLTTLMMVAPSYVVSRILPAKSIRFN